MTELRAGAPSADDLQASDELANNERNRVAIVRGRAEKWLGATAALTGTLTTVLVLKGPDSATKIQLSSRIAVGVILAVALGCLLLAVHYAYRAAFGDPTKLDEMVPQPVTGLAEKLAGARSDSAKKAQSDIRAALIATVLAVALIAGAVAVTWFAPAVAANPDVSVCLSMDGQRVAELPGPSLAVVALEAGAAIGACD